MTSLRSSLEGMKRKVKEVESGQDGAAETSVETKGANAEGAAPDGAEASVKVKVANAEGAAPNGEEARKSEGNDHVIEAGKDVSAETKDAVTTNGIDEPVAKQTTRTTPEQATT